MTSNSPEHTRDHPLWLSLYFRELPLEVFMRGLPDSDRGKPSVIVEKGKVFRLNTHAREIGIRIGNSMDTAYSLSGKVISFERNEQKEQATLAQLAQWAYQFTPCISVRNPDALLLEISGCLRLFRGLDNLRRNIERGLKRLGFAPAIGVNSTPLSALCYARSGTPDNTDTRTVALDHLPVGILMVDEAIIDALLQMGVTTVGQLLELPMSGIARRFGTYFVDHLERLIGDKPDVRKYISEKPHFHSEITFLTDVTDLGMLAFPMNRLAGELGDFLNQRQIATSHLIWRLSHRSHATRSFSIHLASPESDQRIFLPLTQLKLEQIADVEEVDSISLTVTRFSAGQATSGDLFAGTKFRKKDGRIESSHDNERISQLLNMLSAKLGQGACYGLSLENDHRPEKAWHFVRLGERTRHQDNTDEKPRPVFLLDIPKALGKTDGTPYLGGRLALLRGPERIDFGWWDHHDIDKPLARDYYIARQANGALLWVFQYQGEWYLHGIFS